MSGNFIVFRPVIYQLQPRREGEATNGAFSYQRADRNLPVYPPPETRKKNEKTIIKTHINRDLILLSQRLRNCSWKILRFDLNFEFYLYIKIMKSSFEMKIDTG